MSGKEYKDLGFGTKPTIGWTRWNQTYNLMDLEPNPSNCRFGSKPNLMDLGGATNPCTSPLIAWCVPKIEILLIYINEDGRIFWAVVLWL